MLHTAFTRLLRRAVPALALAAASLGIALPARAQVVEMICRMDGIQEVPSNTSAGRGIGFFSVDTVANTMTYRILYAGLSSAETAAHIHGFVAPGVNAGVLHPLPLGTLKCGVWTFTAAQLPSILAGLTYVNVHTTVFPGGEIRGQISELEAHPTYCYGDGSGTACPCLNNSAVGDTEGCLHSGGTGARLVAYGTASQSADTVELHFLRGPASTAVLFFQGNVQIPAGVVFGDGLRCIGGNITRLRIKQTCNGQVGLPEIGEPNLAAMGFIPPLLPGTILPVNYQAWYRNSAAFCTASTFNLTNAVTVNWVP